jgi:hypothetical protein
MSELLPWPGTVALQALENGVPEQLRPNLDD